jgi:integrase/recombinase XerD
MEAGDMANRAKLKVLEAPAPQDALAEAVESFLRRGQARNLSHHTLRFYRTRLDAFTRWLDGQGLHLGPADITPSVVRDFLASETEKVSALTAGHSFITLRALFRFLVREEAVEANPMEKVEKVRVPRKLVETFSQEQVEAMLAACNGSSFNGGRLRAVILTLLDCGLRVSELCGLTLEDVSWDEGTLRVMGKGSKERVVPFGEATRQALMVYVSKRGNVPGQRALFVTCYGDAMNRHEAHRLLSECGKRAGVSGVRCSPHTFRHTCAVMYLRNGGDAFTLQKLLGHSDLAMTRRYCELSQADAVAKHRQCSPGDRFLGAVRGAGGRKRLR